jgi:steroid delta-isomerase-like uncharacterized protein
MSVEERNKAIARRYYAEIMNGADLAVIDELMHPDFLFTLATHPEPFHGPEGFKDLVRMLHGAFPDVHLQVEHLLAQGDTVIGHWTGTGTHTGGPLLTVLGNIPPTGKAFRIDGMTWLTIKDGTIRESLANEDTVGLLTQLGVLPSPEPAPAASSPEQNMATVGRYFNELMNERKLDVIEEIMSPNVAFRIATLPEPIRGHEGMRQFVTGLVTGFPDIKFTVDRQIADGDRVAARWFISGTHDGPFLGFPPSGNKVKDQGVDIFVCQQGKIAEVWVNENDLGLLQQMGVIPTGAATEPAH